MGHKQNGLTYQISEKLKSLAAFGESKHQAKKEGASGIQDKIFSYATMKTYIDRAVKFGKWCKTEHGCRDLAACREYTGEYLQIRGKSCSAYTVKADAAALAKLYGCRAGDLGANTPARIRAAISRSRGPKQMDKHFSEAKNADMVTFCRSTGLRRCELQQLRGNQLRRGADGNFYIAIRGNQAKGGRERDIPIIGNVSRVVELMQAAGSQRVFPRVHAAADIHGYRAEYAAALYQLHARPLEACLADPYRDSRTGRVYRDSVYRCRGDQAGQWFDKKAMLLVSRALGHNRISVVGEHYLYKIMS